MIAPLLRIGIALFAFVGTALAGETAYTGVYESWGRVCQGALRLGDRTVEWKTPFNDCRRSTYEVLDLAKKDEPPRIALRIENPSRRCHTEVIELREQPIGPAPKMWGISAYPSLEAYRNRALPGWKDSTADDRMSWSCPLDPRDDPRR